MSMTISFTFIHVTACKKSIDETLASTDPLTLNENEELIKFKKLNNR